MNTTNKDFDVFLQQRRAAAAAYVNGNASPVLELSRTAFASTFFAPKGGFESGAQKVVTRYETDANAFAEGSTTELEILHSGASGDIGYWVGFQKASVHLKGRSEPVPFNLRVTEIFHRENGAWKMVHRHADPLVEEAKPKS